MKNRIVVLLMIGLIQNFVSAQDYIPSKDDLTRFPSTKTLVVLEDNPLSEYNLMLKETMPKEWKVTPYDYITWKEFEQKRLDPAFSFIVQTQVKIDKDKNNVKYNYMSLLLGGNSYSLNSMPDLCSIPLSYYGVGDNDYSYKVGIFLRFMQKHVKFLQENPGMASENIFKHYNDNIKQLGGKTLYLVASDMAKEVNTESKIRKYYPGPVKLVSIDDIENAIANNENVVFLHKVGPAGTRFKGRCFNILIGADDAQFYYFDYHMVTDNVPDAFLLSDFKKLAKKQ